MDDIIKKIGMSSNPVIRQLANIPRFVIRFFLFRLLRHRKNKAIVQLIKKIQSERGFMMWPDEMVFLATCAKTVTNVRGHIAEVGVASAGSAKLLAEFKGNKELHLFDTFEGLPETKKIDGALRKGQYKYSLEEIKIYLSSHTNVFYYKGIFPDSAGGVAAIQNKKFSLVHLDVDLYESTLRALEFFYPRVEKNGLIISHDYSTLGGVRQAFAEYFDNKPECVIELPTSQCLVVKI